MRRKKRTIELLSPAGSLEAVKAAVSAGADAVYMGGSRFGARAYAESAQEENEDMLLKAIEYCHLFSVKLYMTVNVLFKNREISELISYIRPYYEAGLDAVIVQDLGAVKLIKNSFPDLPVHASTQMTISSPSGVFLAEKLGMERAVLARELSLSEIREIHRKSDLELEVFIHGAMCYCYSGACLFSSLLGDRSGNRGRCAGPCRLPYEIAGKRAYYLSMKDMCTLEDIPNLINAGVTSFKIEGRMKSPIYTAAVTAIYRKYIDLAISDRRNYKVDSKDMEILKASFDRGGFTSYLNQHNSKDMIALNEKEWRIPDNELKDKIDNEYIKEGRKIDIDAFISLHRDAEAVLIINDYDGTYVTEISDWLVESADSNPLDDETIKKQLRKTGGTNFRVNNIEIEKDENVFLPMGVLNKLRRDALKRYKEDKLGAYKRKSRFKSISNR